MVRRNQLFPIAPTVDATAGDKWDVFQEMHQWGQLGMATAYVLSYLH